MEEQLLSLLADTQLSAEGPRKQAEQHLEQAKSNPAFPVSLAAIASHASVSPQIRQSALLMLRTFVERNWSGESDDGPVVLLDDQVKEALRQQMLELATSGEADRKIKSAASYVVSKIANVDFPDQWPSLLPAILHMIPNAAEDQLHGALKVLSDLVEDSLSEDQFFSVARDIVKVVYDVAVSESRKPLLRSLAVSVFRGTFDIMDMVKDEHGPEVKGFADEALSAWLPFFMEIMKKPLPDKPTSGDKGYESERTAQPESWRGLIALKLQVVKTLMKIRAVFPQLLLPQSPVLFTATWEELSLLQDKYKEMYVDNDEQGRLEDADGLPYTLDFLVLEELDFLQSCLRAPPVQKELESQLQQQGGVSGTSWVMDVMKLAVEYAQIPKEEEDLWDIDVNLFLAEETSVTANYTARTACGDLLIKLGEWLHQGALEGLLAYTRILFADEPATWRTKEASLFLLTQLLSDFLDVEKAVTPEIANAYMPLVDYAINRSDEPLFRARGYLVAGILVQSIPEVALSLLDRTIKGVNGDDAEVVKVACIKALQGFVQARTVPADRQVPIIACISEYLYSKDLTDLEDADDLLVTLVETLRAAIQIDPRITVQSDSGALDLLFVLAKHGAANFQLTILVSESFEEIVSSLSRSHAYTALCAKVLPSLTGAFDVGDMTGDDPLVELATELLTVLTENGSEPLPPGYVAAAFPKLNRLLMATTEGGVLRPGAEAIKFMLMHDHQQVFAWQDEANRSGLEVCLIIIDKLLSPAIEDNAASEVGGLAAELVEKAGRERLGPYLDQLLRAVASRLATAEAAPFIQSLILVFARLSLAGAHDVVEFLAQIEINGQNGLQVVLSKWLESSINFAGYDEIRQNVIALSKLFTLNDPRVVQTMVKGELIIPKSDRIMTRSQAKLNPDQYTIIPAPLKILKVLIEELLSASGHSNSLAAAAAAEFADEEADDDGWEDVHTNVLDLGLGSTKAELMAYGEGQGHFKRQRDDETQAYLIEFFIRAGRENLADFNMNYAALSDGEKAKLQELAQGA
ncbi:importin-beta domain-containing protein [Drepanopeziza brunnea f. sp. 'multigermtubi' MB_m1]|uniref:Importin-beta domain-containing protein n=2 Tax=Drepanopeziza brunnea f. sp. 'multigermtubi' TaxID=698441 RepID=K1WHP2_MARBU|nr:importin-beta domain-containing protein [Drepanopeziza brunnea f. sp. 'multigermtubi' MB_m1]EKD12391.1 importin-beta domain-containing protein [Drepanopeziza brunnea f. sp. 'multigermtubi' MB_m1]